MDVLRGFTGSSLFTLFVYAQSWTGCERIEATVRTRRLLWLGALRHVDDYWLLRPKRVLSGELDNAGPRG